MNDNKTPGTDGLPKEFYLRSWDFIGPDLTETLNSIILARQLTETQQQVQVTLLYKKGDLQDIKNWRPISLLNIDYKILLTILTNSSTGN